jgi:integrase
MMATIRLPYLAVDRDRHGNLRHYARVPGVRKKRLPGDPGSEEFMEAYREALIARTQATPIKRKEAVRESFGWLCHQYYKSEPFKSLSESTRRVRRSLLEGICREHGSKPYKGLRARNIRILRDQRGDAKEAANARLKVLRALFVFAQDYEHWDQNPAKAVPYLSNDSGGFHTWTLGEVKAYRRVHPIGSKARLALELLLLTGQRRSDVIRLGRQHVQGGWITFTQFKNRKRKIKKLSIPLLPQLERIIAASPCGDLTFLVTEFGNPFSDGGFGNRMRKWCDEAGLPDCSAHGLRKAGATIAAENGATEHQLMAMFGWDSPKQAAHYTKAASQKRLAGAAMNLISMDQNGNRTVPPKSENKRLVGQSQQKTKQK